MHLSQNRSLFFKFLALLGTTFFQGVSHAECPFLEAVNSSPEKLVLIVVSQSAHTIDLPAQYLPDELEEEVNESSEPDYLHVPHKTNLEKSRLKNAFIGLTEALNRLEEQGILTAFADQASGRFMSFEVNLRTAQRPDSALFDLWVISTAFHAALHVHDAEWRTKIATEIAEYFESEMPEISAAVDNYGKLLIQEVGMRSTFCNDNCKEQSIAAFFNSEIQQVLDLVYYRLDEGTLAPAPLEIMRYFLPLLILAHESGMLKKILSTDSACGVC